MCNIKPLKIKKVFNKHVLLENGIKAYYEKNETQLFPDDMVLVYGNVVINRVKRDKENLSYEKTK